MILSVLALLVALCAVALHFLPNKAQGRVWEEIAALWESVDLKEIYKRLGALETAIDFLYSSGPENSVITAEKKETRHNPNLKELNDGLAIDAHTIVVGNSGSGKTNVVISGIINRLRNGVKVKIIDVKNELGQIFGAHAEIYTINQAEQQMRELLLLAEERRELFNKTSQETKRPCRDYKEYKQITGENLPIICLIIEELVVFMNKVDEKKLIEMLVICRSAGIFVLAVSQYLNKSILSREGSVNFSQRVFLGKPDMITFRILFGTISRQEANEFSEHLTGPGKAIVQTGSYFELRVMPEVTEEYLLPYFE